MSQGSSISRLVAYIGRTAYFKINLFNADGEPFVLASGDAIRIKIGDGAGLLLFDISSADEPSANGSNLTIQDLDPAIVVFTIAQGDTVNWCPGEYVLEIDLVSLSTSPVNNPISPFRPSHTLTVLQSMGGNTGLT